MSESKKRKKNGKVVKKKVVNPPEAEQPKLNCPHCDTPLSNVQWRPFGNEDVMIVGCGHCMTALGATYNFKK